MKAFLIFLLLAQALPAAGWVGFETWADNPAIRPGFLGAEDLGGVFDPELVLQNGQFRLYYTAVDRAGTERIALALSHDTLTWQPFGIVLEPSGENTFDRDAVSAPSIVLGDEGYELYYTGRAGTTPAIGRLVSADGLSFRRPHGGSAPVLEASGMAGTFDRDGVSEPTLIRQGGVTMMMFQGHTDETAMKYLGFAFSGDGIQFTRITGDAGLGANFGPGPHGFDDGGALEPELVAAPDGVRLFYTSLHY